MAHNPGFMKLVNEAKSRIKETDINGYKKMLADGQKAVLIDVREDNEWTAGHGRFPIGSERARQRPELPDVGVVDDRHRIVDDEWSRQTVRVGERTGADENEHGQPTAQRRSGPRRGGGRRRIVPAEALSWHEAL